MDTALNMGWGFVIEFVYDFVACLGN